MAVLNRRDLCQIVTTDSARVREGVNGAASHKTHLPYTNFRAYTCRTLEATIGAR